MYRKKIITLFQFLFFLGLGLFLVWWMIKGIDEEGWKQIRQSLRQAKYWLFLPVLMVLLLSHYIRALRWKLLMEPLGYQPSNANVFNAVMVGYLANLAFPRLGEVLKCTLLARYERVGPDKLVGTIVAERAVDLLCLVIVFALTFFSQIDIVGSYAEGLLDQLIATKGTGFRWGTLLVLFLGIITLLLGGFILVRKYKHTRPVVKITGVFKGIWAGLISIRYVRSKWLFVLHSVLIWGLYFSAARLGFYALDEVAHLGFPEALSILFFGSIGMIVTQGGLGAYAYAVQETLTLYQIDKLVGFTYGWILWVAQTAVILLGGFCSLMLLPIMNRNHNK